MLIFTPYLIQKLYHRLKVGMMGDGIYSPN